MCQFFSFLSNGKGKYYYLNAEQRKEVKGKNDLYPDSHSSIVEYYQKQGVLSNKNTVEDKFNKYEYNPLTKVFEIDQINTKDDSDKAENWVINLDLKTIVPELIIKPIMNPFTDKRRRKVNKKDIARLQEWVKVRHSVSDSVSDSVWDSVWDSVGNSVGHSTWESVWESVWASVWDSVYSYISSFFVLDNWKYIEHEKGVNPFQSCIDLWESGLVPSFDGSTWRLHGHKGKVLFEIDRGEHLK